MATTPGLHPGNHGSSPCGIICPGTPTGRAAWLKPKRLRVRLSLWARFGSVGKGRPPWLRTRDAVSSSLTRATEMTMSSWSSLECSPPCHGGDHGFKSRRGRLQHGTQTAERRSSNLRACGFDSRPCYSKYRASAGHWRAQVAVTHPPSGNAGSTPARRTDTARRVYRFRTSAALSEKPSDQAASASSREKR